MQGDTFKKQLIALRADAEGAAGMFSQYVQKPVWTESAYEKLSESLAEVQVYLMD